jgi:hypothetical protein
MRKPDKTIVINSRVEVYKDKRNWVVFLAYSGKDKNGEPKIQWQESFHRTLSQALMYAAEDAAVDAGSFDEIINAYDLLRNDIFQYATRLESLLATSKE